MVNSNIFEAQNFIRHFSNYVKNFWSTGWRRVRIITDVRRLKNVCVKTELNVSLFSENSRERWARIGERVICGSTYSYILGICHYAPNTFSTLPNLWNRRILARISTNTLYESQFTRLLINLRENGRECRQIFGIHLFSKNWRMCDSAFRCWTCEVHPLTHTCVITKNLIM